MDIVIAGGGIGGLTAAICLARKSHSVTLIEQAPAFSEVGAGLQIGANGMKVLRTLGLEDEIRNVGSEPQKIDLRFGKGGQTIFEIPLGDAGETRWGARYFQIYRADLIAILEREVHRLEVKIQLKSTLKAYAETENGVEIRLENTDTLNADLLIGADGLHSRVREQLKGAEKPEFMGCVAWRGVVPTSHLTTPPPNAATGWVGKGRHAVTYPIRRGELINFVGVVDTDARNEESWSISADKTGFREDFSGWHPSITELIDKGDAFFRWGLFARKPFRGWSSDRVVLLGDAAHPTLPFLAQGAVMAIEDGYVLARHLGDESSPLKARLEAYEAERAPFTRKIQEKSLRNKSIFHLSNPLLRAPLYGAMKLGGTFVPPVIKAQFDWIYGQDVTLGNAK